MGLNNNNSSYAEYRIWIGLVRPITRSSRKGQYRSDTDPEYRIGAPLVKRLWNTLNATFLNVKLQMLCKSHHLQCITSSKDSEKLEKSLCVRNKAEDLCWMPVVFGPSDDTASLIGMILSLTLLNVPRNTSRNHHR